MKRIIFIDDEQNVLHGLQRMLRPMRHQWEMAFASNGEDGLAMFESAPFDVIVTDMRMPGMDGVAILEQVRSRWPHAVRIVLSGYTAVEAAFRAARVAHQFLL